MIRHISLKEQPPIYIDCTNVVLNFKVSLDPPPTEGADKFRVPLTVSLVSKDSQTTLTGMRRLSKKYFSHLNPDDAFLDLGSGHTETRIEVKLLPEFFRVDLNKEAVYIRVSVQKRSAGILCLLGEDILTGTSGDVTHFRSSRYENTWSEEPQQKNSSSKKRAQPSETQPSSPSKSTPKSMKKTKIFQIPAPLRIARCRFSPHTYTFIFTNSIDFALE
jgi:hypothetical protein